MDLFVKVVSNVFSKNRHSWDALNMNSTTMDRSLSFGLWELKCIVVLSGTQWFRLCEGEKKIRMTIELVEQGVVFWWIVRSVAFGWQGNTSTRRVISKDLIQISENKTRKQTGRRNRHNFCDAENGRHLMCRNPHLWQCFRGRTRTRRLTSPKQIHPTDFYNNTNNFRRCVIHRGFHRIRGHFHIWSYSKSLLNQQ
jgi:hypothetical protein